MNKKHISYEELINQAGEVPVLINKKCIYGVLTDEGKVDTYTTFELALTAANDDKNKITEIVVNKEEYEKSLKQVTDFHSKIDEIWFSNLFEEFPQLEADTLFELWEFLEFISIKYIDGIYPDDMYENLQQLYPIFEMYSNELLESIGDVRQAFYFKDQGKIVKL